MPTMPWATPVPTGPRVARAMKGDMALLILAGTALLFTAVRLASRLPDRGLLAWLLAVGLLAWASAVGSVLVAGTIVRQLTPAVLLLVAVGWALAAELLWQRHPPRRPWNRSWRLTRDWLPVVALAAVVLASWAWRLVLAVRLPVLGVLDWQYHLVTVEVWLQAGHIVRVAQNTWTDGWPAAGELLTTWLAVFTHSDRLTGFTSILPVPIAVIATAGLARVFGAGRQTAATVGLMVGCLPALLAMAGTAYVDSAAMASAAATWWLGLRMIRGERAAAAVQFGIAAGLGLGTKGTNLLLLAPILVAVAALLVREAWQRRAHRRAMASSLATVSSALVPFLVIGASWYIKNLLLHGNPLYPVAIGPLAGPSSIGTFGVPPKPPQIDGLPAVFALVRSWVADWAPTGFRYNERLGGFGLAWVPVLGLGLAGAVLLARRRSYAALALVVAPVAVTLILLTSRWYARYTLFMPLVALALAAVALDLAPRGWRTTAITALVVLSVVSSVLTNVHPNVPTGDGELLSPDAYLALVVGGSHRERMNIGRRAACAGLRDVPRGARVVVARNYFLPHAAAGPRMNRILTAALPLLRTSAKLRRAMDARHATWLLVNRATDADRAAARDRAFIDYGPVCANGHLWRYLPIQPAPPATPMRDAPPQQPAL